METGCYENSLIAQHVLCTTGDSTSVKARPGLKEISCAHTTERSAELERSQGPGCKVLNSPFVDIHFLHTKPQQRDFILSLSMTGKRYSLADKEPAF